MAGVLETILSILRREPAGDEMGPESMGDEAVDESRMGAEHINKMLPEMMSGRQAVLKERAKRALIDEILRQGEM